MHLSQFDFNIQYIKGENNVIADSLSRPVNAPGISEDKEKSELIKFVHEVDLAHGGVSKTAEFTRRLSNWKGLHNDVKNVVKNCDSCCRFKPQNTKHKAKLGTLESHQPFETWHSDFIGPLPTTNNGNRFILIFIDPFSKWIEAFATSDQTSSTTIKYFTEVISRFGIPKIIHSDQGPNYESFEFRKFCELYNIGKTRTTPYHPEGNGIAERAVQTLKQTLNQIAENDFANWDLHLWKVLMSMRNSSHKSTNYTPSMIVYGCNLRSVSEARLNIEGITPIYNKAQIIKEVRNNLCKSQNENAKYYNQRSACDKNHKVGEIIDIKKPQRTSMEPLYWNPVKIIAADPPIYTVVTPENKRMTIHNTLTKSYGTVEDSIQNLDENDSHSRNEFKGEDTYNEDDPVTSLKRKIKILAKNLDCCRRHLPSFTIRDGVSE
ncbi:Pro-Pol polyprotein [Thelohanellus kitauei]|uniref:Pro-Pol polyprotein n=1 Tax=Thelohanellus kitauei TaxID=669202 RepID=A0A0C2MTP7_THEKT|nr:Pro-Pol polyprotein [Thelohanellus kitauei]